MTMEEIRAELEQKAHLPKYLVIDWLRFVVFSRKEAERLYTQWQETRGAKGSLSTT